MIPLLQPPLLPLPRSLPLSLSRWVVLLGISVRPDEGVVERVEVEEGDEVERGMEVFLRRG